jgi:hypothetical protein
MAPNNRSPEPSPVKLGHGVMEKVEEEEDEEDEDQNSKKIDFRMKDSAKVDKFDVNQVEVEVENEDGNTESNAKDPMMQIENTTSIKVVKEKGPDTTEASSLPKQLI